MVAVAILAAFVAGMAAVYLLMVTNEYTAVARSQTWNSALSVAEGGVEEALQAINKNASLFGKIKTWTNSVVSSDGWNVVTTNVTWRSNGVAKTWGFTNGVVYHIRHALDASGSRYYDVFINNTLNSTNSGPEVLSIGYASDAGRSAVRKVYLKTKQSSINGNLAARASITLSGNNITADSFSSSDPYHSSWQTNMTYKGTNYYGFYPTNPTALTLVTAPDYTDEPYRRKDNAYVASNGSVSVGNANVCGYVDTGPGQSQPSVGPNGVVGANKDWIGNGTTCDPLNPSNNGIQSGHWVNDMNFNFTDVSLPNTNGVPWVTVQPRNGANRVSFGTTNLDANAPYLFTYVITNGAYGGTTNYQITSEVNDSVLIRGTNIVLYLPQGLNFHGNGNTIWVDTNSDLTIYAGSSIDCTGNGNIGINNIQKYAPSFSIYGLPACSQIKLAGQPTLTAYVYAPQAELSLVGGGGSSYYDAVGAFYVNVVKMTGNMNFHYDENLDKLTPPTGYLPKLWLEVQ